MRERISSASIISSTAISDASEMRISGLRMLSDVDIARKTNEEADRRLPLPRHLRRHVKRARRADQRAQAAVHAPFRLELARARGLETGAGGNACGQLAERRFRRQLAAAQREPQSVAGHRIDEAGRIAGEQ